MNYAGKNAHTCPLSKIREVFVEKGSSGAVPLSGTCHVYSVCSTKLSEGAGMTEKTHIKTAGWPGECECGRDAVFILSSSLSFTHFQKKGHVI